ncbi:LOW QUALITY PROTEIN: hypothetical protein Cgig2_027951 [Carnegiea gigantea]|uniref:Uncharacterized protein n=1 Tax=Carnegiea gigantea TaxID=171969 RepID=A0A9Q1JMD4_9CARY|nr:LOW QUALITY PROTEIN: hypothetical protein Cgig2_027951 [Carnegiea gigantea]
MIRLPVRFGNKLRSKNLEVDFLVIDVPTAYNVILGCPTVHKVVPHILRRLVHWMSSLSSSEPLIIVLEPSFHRAPVQLLHSPHHNIHTKPTGEAQFGGIIYNHGVKDCQHHLWEVGIIGVSPRHLEVKTEGTGRGSPREVAWGLGPREPSTTIKSGHGHTRPYARGAGGCSIQSPPPGRPRDHRLPLHQPPAGAALPSVCDRHSSSKPRNLTTSDPPGPISGPWSRAPRPTRQPHSITRRRMSPVPFQGAQNRPPHPQLRITKSMGIWHGSLREGDEADAKLSSGPNKGLPYVIGHLPSVVNKRERHNSKEKQV